MRRGVRVDKRPESSSVCLGLAYRPAIDKIYLSFCFASLFFLEKPRFDGSVPLFFRRRNCSMYYVWIQDGVFYGLESRAQPSGASHYHTCGPRTMALGLIS